MYAEFLPCDLQLGRSHNKLNLVTYDIFQTKFNKIE